MVTLSEIFCHIVNQIFVFISSTNVRWRLLNFYFGGPYHTKTSPLIFYVWFLYDKDLRHERVKHWTNDSKIWNKIKIPVKFIPRWARVNKKFNCNYLEVWHEVHRRIYDNVKDLCSANQLTGFYMRATLRFNGLIALFVKKELFPLSSSLLIKSKVNYKISNILPRESVVGKLSSGHQVGHKTTDNRLTMLRNVSL